MYSVRVRYGVDEQHKTFDDIPTVRQIRTDHNLRSILGFGDNVRCLLSGVELPDDAQVPSGSLLVIETRANQKA